MNLSVNPTGIVISNCDFHGLRATDERKVSLVRTRDALPHGDERVV